MLFTWDTTDLCIIFRWWHIQTTAGLIFSLLGVVALTAFYEVIRSGSRRYEQWVNKRTEEVPRKLTRPFPIYVLWNLLCFCNDEDMDACWEEYEWSYYWENAFVVVRAQSGWGYEESACYKSVVVCGAELLCVYAYVSPPFLLLLDESWWGVVGCCLWLIMDGWCCRWELGHSWVTWPLERIHLRRRTRLAIERFLACNYA